MIQHLIISGYDSEKTLKGIEMEIHFEFAEDYPETNREMKLRDLIEKFEAVIKEYFPDTESELLSDFQYEELKNAS